jgi:methionine-rich copper-binding protein CopC
MKALNKAGYQMKQIHVMRTTSVTLRYAPALLLALITSSILTLPASANSLTNTVPISGAILTIAPSTVSLTTDTPLASMGSEIKVTDPKGNQVDDGALTVDGTSAVIGLLNLTEKGVYTVEYSLISDSDIPLVGSYTFTYNAPDQVTTPKPTQTQDAEVTSKSNVGTTIFVILVGVAGLLVAIGLVWYGKKLYNER